MAYESSKQMLIAFGGEGTQSNPLAILAAGGFCGMTSFAVLCMNPFCFYAIGLY